MLSIIFIIILLVIIIAYWVDIKDNKHLINTLLKRIDRLENFIAQTFPKQYKPDEEYQVSDHCLDCHRPFTLVVRKDNSNICYDCYQKKATPVQVPAEEKPGPAVMAMDKPREIKTTIRAEEQPAVPAPPSKEEIINRPPGRKIKKTRQASSVFTKIEGKFAENWTGILGSIILVMGIAFLGIYTALKLLPFYRFLIISGFSFLLYMIYYALKKKPDWHKFSLLLRSTAFATFLFVCVGSSRIHGLKWINNDYYGLLLILIGILGNLIIAYRGRRQIFAGFHVFLSLIALAIAPQENYTLIIAGAVTLFGISLTYREKWDLHLLLTTFSFFIYYLYWGTHLDFTHFSVQQDLLGIGVITIVYLAALLVHYHAVYKNRKFEVLPFIVHLLNWSFFSIGLLIHYRGAPWNTLLLFLCSIAVFILAYKAKKADTRWLYITDTLVAEFLCLIAILSTYNWAYKWNVSYFLLLTLTFLQSIIYLTVMIVTHEQILKKVGVYLVNIFALIILILGLKTRIDGTELILQKETFLLIISSIAGCIFHLYSLKKSNETLDVLKLNPENSKANVSLLGILSSLMLLTAYIRLLPFTGAEYIVIPLACVFLYLRQKYQSNGLGMGMLLTIIIIHLFWWDNLLVHEDWDIQNILIHSLPSIILSFISIKKSYIAYSKKYLKWIGIYLFGINLFLISYKTAGSVSLFLPGIIWLIFSIIYLHISAYLTNKNQEKVKGNSDRFILHVGYGFIFAFLIRHFIVHLSSSHIYHYFHIQSHVIVLYSRVLLAGLGIITFFYWLLFKKPSGKNVPASWEYLRPLFMELLLLFITITLIREISEFQLPFIWIIIALICLGLGKIYSEHLSRLKVYSVFYFWISILNTLSIAHAYVFTQTNESIRMGLIIFSQLFFIFLTAKDYLWEKISFPRLLNFIKLLIDEIKYVKKPGIFFFALYLVWLSYKLTYTLSVFLPGFLWLIISVFYLRSSLYFTKKYTGTLLIQNKIDKTFLYTGYLFILFFLLRYITVHIQSAELLWHWQIKSKNALEIIALFVFAYWASYKKQVQEKGQKIKTDLNPLFIELIMLLLIIVGITELSSAWHPVMWISAALICLLTGIIKNSLSRLKMYSLLFFWISAVYVAFYIQKPEMLQGLNTVQDSLYWIEHYRIKGFLTIFIQIIYLLIFYQANVLKEVKFPLCLNVLHDITVELNHYKNVFIFYPLFISIALFLYHSFDYTFLTILWVIESFIIFILSIILRKNHFRYASLIALSICLVRLIFYDLAKSNTLTRALVFIGVGIIMLFMNSFYNKYKARFDNAED